MSVTGCPHVCVTARLLLREGVLIFGCCSHAGLSLFPWPSCSHGAEAREPEVALRPPAGSPAARPSGLSLSRLAMWTGTLWCWLVAVIGAPLGVPDFHALGAGNSLLPPQGVQAGLDLGSTLTRLGPSARHVQ